MDQKKIKKDIELSLKKAKFVILLLGLVVIIAIGWIVLGNVSEDSYQQGAIDGSNSIVQTILQGVSNCKPFEITFNNQTFQLTDVRCFNG